MFLAAAKKATSLKALSWSFIPDRMRHYRFKSQSLGTGAHTFKIAFGGALED